MCRIGIQLKLAQEIHDLRLAPFNGTNKFAAHDAIAIDDVGLGPLEGTINRTGLLVRITHGQEVYLVVLQELVVSIAINIDADADDSYALILKALLQLHQRRHLLYAGRAPRSPKVQDHDFSVEFAKCDLAVGILDHKVGSSGANARRSGAAVAGCQQNCKDGKDN